MLTLLNKLQNKDKEHPVGSDYRTEPKPEEHVERQPDEATLKKNIAAKLKNYQPLEREANFTGPKYYQ